MIGNSFKNAYFDLRRVLFSNVQKANTPVCILLSGQTGCGKSALSSYTKSDLKEFGSVILDPDYIRAYHPYFNDYVSTGRNPMELDQDCWEWQKDLFYDALNKGFNIILEGTLGNDPERWIKRASDASDKGYRVSINALAVNEVVSKIGISKRYERTLLTDKYSRAVPIDYHNKVYKSIPGVIERIFVAGCIDKIILFKRTHFEDNNSTEAGLEVNQTANLIMAAQNFLTSYFSERRRSFHELEVSALRNDFIITEDLIKDRNGNLSEFWSIFELTDLFSPEELKKQIIFISTPTI